MRAFTPNLKADVLISEFSLLDKMVSLLIRRMRPKTDLGRKIFDTKPWSYKKNLKR